MRASYLFTSESVSEGHPDKVSDQISDAILDAFLEKDVKLGIADDSLVNTRLGCETLCTTNKIVIAGEGRGQLFRTIHGVSVVDRELICEIARGVVKDIGYDQNAKHLRGLTGRRRRILGHARVERPPAAHDEIQRAHRFLQGCVGVGPVGIKNVHIIQFHPL